MKKEFVLRGKTASGTTEKLSFSGHKLGYAYRLTEFQIYPSTNIGGVNAELAASITAAKTFEDPENPNFKNEGLIGTALFPSIAPGDKSDSSTSSIVNDTYLITQDLILAVVDTIAGSPMDVNWQCRFVSVKMTGPEEAVTNYKQFMISDE